MSETAARRTGRGYSLWVVPPEPVYSQLRDLIRGLSKRFDAPMQMPHVTLLGPVLESEKDVRRKADILTAIRGPLQVTLDGSFRYFDAENKWTLAAITDNHIGFASANTALRIRYGTEDRPGHVPHMSLLYRRLAMTEATALMNELASDFPVSFETHTVGLYSTKGPVEDWHMLDEFKLAGRRSV